MRYNAVWFRSVELLLKLLNHGFAYSLTVPRPVQFSLVLSLGTVFRRNR